MGGWIPALNFSPKGGSRVSDATHAVFPTAYYFARRRAPATQCVRNDSISADHSK
jgi:hypothetical protein